MGQKEHGMRIIELSAENVKRIKAVSIKPAGPVVEITGKNRSGKTSVLDSIWWALGGKDGIQAVPLRKGAEKGSIRLDLGDLIVERKFNASGATTLTVTNKGDKALHRSPQAVLDSLMGRMSFDPLAFAKQKPRDQYDEIRRIAKVTVDLDALDAANKADFDKRTDINRRTKLLKAQAEGIHAPQDPPVRVNVSQLAAEMEAASRHNAALEAENRKRQQAERVAQEANSHAEELARNLPKLLASMQSQMEVEISTIRQKYADSMAHVRALCDDAARESEQKLLAFRNMAHPGAPIDISAIRAKIEQAEQITRDCDLYEKRAALMSEAKAAEAEAAALTAAIEQRDSEKLTALQNAEMPVPGLSLADGVVMLDGLPLDQASDAQQLRLSVAVAMAANSKLRVIRIRDGSLLDEDGMKILAEMATESDYQVWIERVDSSGEVGIVMVDGEVAADHQAVSE